jgi:hypothetical protein
LGCSATFRNMRSKSELGSSAPTSRAMSMNRLDCAGSSGGGLGLRGIFQRALSDIHGQYATKRITNDDPRYGIRHRTAKPLGIPSRPKSRHAGIAATAVDSQRNMLIAACSDIGRVPKEFRKMRER